MKKIMYIILAILTLWSCSNEKLEVPQEGKTPAGAVKVSMTFPGRTLAPMTYAGTYPADVTEKSLISDQVRVFIFGDKGGQPDRLLISEKVNTLVEGDSEKGVSAEFFIRKFGKLHMVATANIDFNADQRQRMLGQTFDEFSKTIVKQPAGMANAFAMASDIVTADIPDPKTATPLPAISFLLERLSARIDLENLTTTQNGGKFVLEGARLKGAIDRSFLIKGQSPGLNIGNPTYRAVAIESFDWIENTGVSGDMKKMYMKMYTYENVLADTLVVDVKGTFKGVPAQFKIRFDSKTVKRNTRYLVNIKNVEGNNVIFDIKEKDWEEGGTINIKPDITASEPMITKIEPSDISGNTVASGHSVSYSDSSTDPDKVNEINLDSPTLYYTKITVESGETEAIFLVNKAEVPWVSVKELGQSNLADGKLMQTFLVTYSATQDLYPRTAELELQNKFNPDKTKPHIIKITQPKATTTANHLARFANANVGALNQFADVITPNNLTDYDNLGKYYQWGRNVAFDYNGAITTTTNKSDGNNDELWSNKFISVPAPPFFWQLTNLGDTWTEVVSKATSAPAAYTGTNGGDPSPIGYRMPEAEELRAIMGSDDVNINFHGEVDISNKPETLKIDDVSANYTADYYSTIPNIIYALKMKDNTNDKLTAYRYEYGRNSGVSVTSRLLGTAGAATTIQDVANESFWKDATKGGSDVIRYFPSLGLRSYDAGKPGFRGTNGLYWTSTGVSDSNSWSLDFNSAVSRVHGNNIKVFAFTIRPILRK